MTSDPTDPTCTGPISDSLLKVNALRGAAGAYGFNNYVRNPLPRPMAHDDQKCC
jgi:hypothetical protein